MPAFEEPRPEGPLHETIRGRVEAVARYIRVNTGVGRLATLMSPGPRRCRRPDTIEKAMRPDLKALRHLSDLDRLLDDSTRRPVLLFKHSYSCGTSAEALDELIEHLDDARRDEADYAVVTVQTHRDVSNAVSAAARRAARDAAGAAHPRRPGRLERVALPRHAPTRGEGRGPVTCAIRRLVAASDASRRSSPPPRPATIRPSKSPSRQSRMSSGATSAAQLARLAAGSPDWSACRARPARAVKVS